MVVTTFVIKWTTRRLVEDAIGDQMVMQARIAAHLVAVAEQRPGGGLSPAEINRHLKTSSGSRKSSGGSITNSG